MKVDLRKFSRLMNELVPLFILKTHNVTAVEAMEILQDKFGITCRITPSDQMLSVEMDEDTFTWVALKWH